MSYETADSQKEEFRKYLEQLGFWKLCKQVEVTNAKLVSRNMPELYMFSFAFHMYGGRTA